MIDYYEVNFDFLYSFNPMSRETYDQLYAIANLKQLKTNDKLVNIGDIPQKLYLINRGVIRSYVILDSGKEVTKTLFTPIEFFASFSALLDQTPSTFIYQALADCDVYEIDYAGFVELCSTNLEVLVFYTKYLEYLFKVGEENHIELLSMDGTQRYLKLRERIPEIDNLIPQYQIASYLNITPVQLSRIRAKLY